MDAPDRNEQVIRRDVGLVRLSYANLQPDPTGCRVLRIEWTPSGFYRVGNGPASFLAYDVTPLWDAKHPQ